MHRRPRLRSTSTAEHRQTTGRTRSRRGHRGGTQRLVDCSPHHHITHVYNTVCTIHVNPSSLANSANSACARIVRVQCRSLDQELCVAVHISLQIVTITCAHISGSSNSIHLDAHADQLKLATLSKVLVYDVLDATDREPACFHMGLRGRTRPTRARIISILSST